MKHFIIVLTVALITLGIMFAIYRPDILENIWLWVIGLIGPVIALIKEVIRYFSKLVKDIESKEFKS